MRSIQLTILLAALTTLGHSQDLSVQPATQAIKGRPQTVEHERIYVRYRGKNIGEQTHRISSDKYDAEGRITESVEYGNGQSRTTYRYSEAKTAADVTYTDTAGNRIESAAFHSNTDDIKETGLCSSYAIKSENDELAKIERTREICGDGLTRAEIVDEFDSAGNLVRSVRTDAQSRRWEFVQEFNAEGILTEYRLTVSLPTKPPYTQTVRCSDHKVDEYGNWIRFTATSFISTHPDLLVFQYNESRKITYYPEPSKK
ncbi:MAG TPA: hypothetical protein VJV05_17955 [Pyrinomonadaceae bacterium]|nr:hypothetical protein [Pyrinomonadaceae bacterium]